MSQTPLRSSSSSVASAVRVVHTGKADSLLSQWTVFLLQPVFEPLAAADSAAESSEPMSITRAPQAESKEAKSNTVQDTFKPLPNTESCFVRAAASTRIPAW